MWCSERRRVLSFLAGLPALAACGFQPLYGESAPAEALRGQLSVGKISYGPLPNRLSFRLAETLRRGIGEETRATYRINATVAVEEQGLAITPDNATTRYNLSAKADWTMVPAGRHDAALSGVAESYTAYSATASVYATRIAKRDAEERLARALAETILIQIAARANEVAG